MRLHRLSLLGTLFVVAVTVGIAGLDLWGGYLDAYFEEYATGGSCEWRFSLGEGNSARRVFLTLLRIGLLAWPFGILALLSAAQSASPMNGRLKWASFADIVVVLACWAYLVGIGAPAAALEFCR